MYDRKGISLKKVAMLMAIKQGRHSVMINADLLLQKDKFFQFL